MYFIIFVSAKYLPGWFLFLLSRCKSADDHMAEAIYSGWLAYCLLSHRGKEAGAACLRV
jgi:hypothetical protein